MRIVTSFFAAVTMAAFTTSSALAVNIAVNGGFEIAGGGGPTDSADWNEFGGGAPGNQSVRGGPPASGSFAHEMTAIGANMLGAAAGINQNSALNFGSLLGGSTVSLSFDYQTNLGPGGVAFAALRILDSNGAIVAGGGPPTMLSASPTYTNFSLPSLAVPPLGAFPNDFYSAFIEFSASAGAFDGAMATLVVDNVVVNATLVPEPTAATFLGLGFLGLLRRRRSH